MSGLRTILILLSAASLSFALASGCPTAMPSGGGGNGEPDCDAAADCAARACQTAACTNQECVYTDACAADHCIDETCVECIGSGECDDGKLCTDDVCSNGSCGFPAVVCPPNETCTPGQGCTPTGTLCATRPEGTLCNDGNLCTDNDACERGVCSGTPVDCNDGDPCTDDSCSLQTGNCIHDVVACPEGTLCNRDTGECVECATPADCDDGVFCNGTENCDSNTGFCVTGTRPCDDAGGRGCAGGAAESCSEGDTAAVCTPCDGPCYTPGQPVTRTVSINPPRGTFVYGVEDSPPVGWIVAAPSISDDGEYDAGNNAVKWFFLDDEQRTLTYNATPPSGGSGERCFEGIVNYDGGTSLNTQSLCLDQCGGGGSNGGGSGPTIRELSFAPPREYSVTAWLESISTGDLNGDGLPDLAACISGNDTLAVFLNNGDGTLGSPESYATGPSPYSVALADMNGDGFTDLVVGTVGNEHSGTGNVVVFENDQDGRAAFRRGAVALVGQFPYSITAGDLNRDGHPDVAVVGHRDEVEVLLNDGTGFLEVVGTYSAGAGLNQSILAEDLDNDGDLDLVMVNVVEEVVSILPNQGDGSFGSRATYEVGGDSWSVAVGDFDSDGVLDLAVPSQSEGPGNSVSVLLRQGSGSFGAGSYAPRVRYDTGEWPWGVATADFDGDGDIDVATANRITRDVSVLRNDGNGTMAAAIHFAVGDQVSEIVAEDMNQDGWVDVVTGSSNSAAVYVMINDTETHVP